jgi:hypothetical protein
VGEGWGEGAYKIKCEGLLVKISKTAER